MHRIILAVVIVGVFSAHMALAAPPNEPKIAKTAKVSVVTAYEPCTSPTLTTSTGDAACPAVRSDPGCGFGTGHGLMYVRTKGATGWAVKIVLLGLESACEGQTIQFFASLRSTSDECGTGPLGPSCTVGFPNILLGPCTVTHTGFSGLSTPVFATPALLTKLGGVEITDLVGKRGSLTSFRYGIVTAF